MARPKANSLKIPWKGADPCPCGKALTYERCCYNETDQLPLCTVGSLHPPGQVTGYENPKCFLKYTANCGPKITREHYVSASVLSLLGDLSVEGMPWQQPGEISLLAKSNLTSKVLCGRHNNALSPLDAAAGHAFEQIFGATRHALKDSVSRASKYFLINGDAFELWALKTLLGLFHAKISRASGATMMGEFKFDYSVAYEAFFGVGLPEPLGLFIHPEIGATVENRLGFSALYSADGGILVGLRLQVQGIFMDFVFDRRDANPDFFIEKKYYRPWVLDFTGRSRTSRAIISWRTQRQQATRVNINYKLDLSERRGL